MDNTTSKSKSASPISLQWRRDNYILGTHSPNQAPFQSRVCWIQFPLVSLFSSVSSVFMIVLRESVFEVAKLFIMRLGASSGLTLFPPSKSKISTCRLSHRWDDLRRSVCEAQSKSTFLAWSRISFQSRFNFIPRAVTYTDPIFAGPKQFYQFSFQIGF